MCYGEHRICFASAIGGLQQSGSAPNGVIQALPGQLFLPEWNPWDFLNVLQPVGITLSQSRLL